MRAEIFFEGLKRNAGELLDGRARGGVHLAIHFFEAAHGVERAFRGIARVVGQADAVAIGFCFLFLGVAGFVEELNGLA